MSYANKVVLITGASSGIGAATAIAFAKQGANVVMVARNEAKLKNVADQCETNGKKPYVIKADITLEDQVEATIKECIEKFGKLDVLVNNAGAIRYGSLTGGNILKAYDEVMMINMRAQMHVTSEAVKYLKESKGNVVNMSSIAGLLVPSAMSNLMAYSMSKAALNQFTRCSALELSQFGVRVNAVCPGFVRSDIMENSGVSFSLDSYASSMPLGRISEPEDIADIVLFLASDKAKSVTGITYAVDNGHLLLSK